MKTISILLIVILLGGILIVKYYIIRLGKAVDNEIPILFMPSLMLKLQAAQRVMG